MSTWTVVHLDGVLLDGGDVLPDLGVVGVICEDLKIVLRQKLADLDQVIGYGCANKVQTDLDAVQLRNVLPQRADLFRTLLRTAAVFQTNEIDMADHSGSS